MYGYWRCLRVRGSLMAPLSERNTRIALGGLGEISNYDESSCSSQGVVADPTGCYAG